MNSDVAPPVPLAGPVASMDILGSRRYLGFLVVAAVLGVPIWALVYWFLALVGAIQGWAFTSLPHSLGFATAPLWWPLVPLGVAGALVGPVVRYLPGHGGESPANGFRAGGGFPAPAELGGIGLRGGDRDWGDDRGHAAAADDLGPARHLFLRSTGLTVIPIVIVGVVVSHVITLRLPDPGPHVSASAPEPAPVPAPAPARAPAPAPEPSPTTTGLTS